MVKGIDFFKDYFSEFANEFVLIGGTACDIMMENAGLDFRATKDLDIVLCVEALSMDFVVRFKQFIKAGGYAVSEREDQSKCFYRFIKPSSKDFPQILEFFSKSPDILGKMNEGKITPIFAENQSASLSAILLDEEYYQFIMKERSIVFGISIAMPVCLISLKAKAWMDLSERRADGENVDSSNINKHKNDIFRLYQLLNLSVEHAIPDAIKKDMNRFLTLIEAVEVDLRQLGIKNIDKKQIIADLKKFYGI